jgi:hypothetical protein
MVSSANRMSPLTNWMKILVVKAKKNGLACVERCSRERIFLREGC